MDKINKLSLPVTIIIASVILGGFYFASQQRTDKISSSELYKINADCERQAQLWTKNNSTALTMWSVNRNAFNNTMASCIAEFIESDPVYKGDVKAIYNLTHNEQLARINPLSDIEMKQDKEHAYPNLPSNQSIHDRNEAEYEKVYNEVFVK